MKMFFFTVYSFSPPSPFSYFAGLLIMTYLYYYLLTFWYYIMSIESQLCQRIMNTTQIGVLMILSSEYINYNLAPLWRYPVATRSYYRPTVNSVWLEYMYVYISFILLKGLLNMTYLCYYRDCFCYLICIIVLIATIANREVSW